MENLKFNPFRKSSVFMPYGNYFIWEVTIMRLQFEVELIFCK